MPVKMKLLILSLVASIASTPILAEPFTIGATAPLTGKTR